MVQKGDGIILKVKIKPNADCDDAPRYQWCHDGFPITGTYTFSLKLLKIYSKQPSCKKGVAPMQNVPCEKVVKSKVVAKKWL